MKTLKSSKGMALFVAILVMGVIMLFLGVSLFLSRIDTRITSNLKLGTQALVVADAGLQHAFVLIPWVWDFDNQLNCGTPPCTLVSNPSFPAGSGFSYTVTAQNDVPDINNGGSPTDDTNNLIILTSSAGGPAGATRTVEAYVRRSLLSFTPPGALYLPGSSATVKFKKNNFLITGNDTDFNGGPPANPNPAIPGVVATSDAVGDTFKNALGSSRYNLVQGSGYSAGPPVIPSVITTNDILDINQIALNFYNQASAVKLLDGYHTDNGSCPESAPCVLGTDASPQITYIREGEDHTHLDGYVTGSGVLVIEGKAHLYGNFNFHGLVVAVDLGLTVGTAGTPNHHFKMKKDAKIFGGLLIGPAAGEQKFEVEDDARIYYSSQALAMVNSNWASLLPRPPRVFAWQDKY